MRWTRLLPAAATVGLMATLVATAPASSQADGIHKIDHVVVIMQENRSFDSYFGTYPGADGIPKGVCLPDREGGCVAPYHDPADRNEGGPHGSGNAINDIDGDRMDGFVKEAEAAQRTCAVNDPTCGSPTDVMGWHDSRELPLYWDYAHRYTL